MALPADGAEAVVTCDWIDSDGPVGAERQMGAKTERERAKERERETDSLCLSPFSPFCFATCEMQLPAEPDGISEHKRGEMSCMCKPPR